MITESICPIGTHFPQASQTVFMGIQVIHFFISTSFTAFNNFWVSCVLFFFFLNT